MRTDKWVLCITFHHILPKFQETRSDYRNCPCKDLGHLPKISHDCLTKTQWSLPGIPPCTFYHYHRKQQQASLHHHLEKFKLKDALFHIESFLKPRLIKLNNAKCTLLRTRKVWTQFRHDGSLRLQHQLNFTKLGATTPTV